MELIRMIDYVLYEYEKLYDNNGFLNDRLKNIINYANFLKMKLELCMFIPCWSDGEVILFDEEKEPYVNTDYGKYFLEPKQYQEAKDRVIFEDCDFEKFKYVYIINFNKVGKCITSNSKTNKTIEDLTSLGLTITQKAIEKYNLK